MQAAFAKLPKPVVLQPHFLVALIALFLALSIQYGNKVRGGGSAIMRWRNQLLDLGDKDIYTSYAYPNPPIMALLLEPIANLPPLVGSLLWFYLRVGMAVGAVLLFFRIIETKEAPFPTWAKNLTILLSLRPVIGDLTHGNVNLFILFLVASGLYAFHRGRDYLGGISIALAIACKVTPALFIPYFLWKRAWKTLAGIAFGLVLFLFLVPAPFVGGFGRNLELLRSWTDQMVTPFLVQGVVTSEHQNQSLPGLLYRLTTASPSFLDEQAKPARYDNLIGARSPIGEVDHEGLHARVCRRDCLDVQDAAGVTPGMAVGGGVQPHHVGDADFQRANLETSLRHHVGAFRRALLLPGGWSSRAHPAGDADWSVGRCTALDGFHQHFHFCSSRCQNG